MEAAMIVMAPSEPPQRVTATVSTVRNGLARHRKSWQGVLDRSFGREGCVDVLAVPVRWGNMAILMKDATPAL